MAGDAEDRAIVETIRDGMTKVLAEFGMTPQLASNLATTFAELGYKADITNSVAGWTAILVLLSLAKPPVQSVADVVALRTIATRMLLADLRIAMDDRIMKIVGIVAEQRWDDLHGALQELAAAKRE